MVPLKRLLRPSSLVLFLCSLGIGALLFFIAPAPRAPRLPPQPGGYTALALEESVPDRETALALEEEFGQEVISWSSQWALVDSFGSLEPIPLDAYEERLEPFDPRRDGYAETLRNFFVHDGQRWFFVKTTPTISISPGKAFQGPSRGLYGLIFALAWAAALFLAHRASRKTLPLLIFLAPPMFSLSLWGAPGFALLVLIFLLGNLLADPLRELFAGKGARIAPYRFRWGIPPVLCLVLIACTEPRAIVGILGLFGLYAAYLWLGTRRKFPSRPEDLARYGRHRFVPVPILPTRTLDRTLAPVLAPFVLAACLAVLPLAVPSAPPEETAGFSGPLVTEADYDAHVQYQMNFSRRSLHVPPLGQADTGFQENSYFRYTIGEDGLVAGQYTAPDTPDIPPFPLADLNAFLSAGSPAPSKAGIVEWGDLLPALLVFILTLPLFIAARRGKRGRKRIPAYYDKRIAA